LGIEYLEGESFSDRNGVAQECQARGYDEAGGDTPPGGTLSLLGRDLFRDDLVSEVVGIEAVQTAVRCFRLGIH